ncbi:MAG: type VI secretion system baseplate subunit TssK [Proteobacteria bacterium]|nr:type VI secretion system baseplate subunit TssK [Pseudomonadota bacterium]
MEDKELERSNRDIPEALIWHDGMDLSPQHLQQGFQRAERLARFQVQETQPHNWGVRVFEIDEVGLADGLFKIRQLEAKMEDGLEINYIEGDFGSNPLTLDLDEEKSKITQEGAIVELIVPAEMESMKKGKGITQRFRTVDADFVTDETTEEEPLTIPRWRPQLSLRIHEDESDTYTTLPLARIINSDSGLIKADYLPPTMALKHNPLFQTLCGGISKTLREKAVFLAEKIKTMSLGEEPLEIMAIQHQIKTLVSTLPTFEINFNNADLHPSRLYSFLSLMAGEISSLSPELIPPVFPPYQHDKIYQLFNEISSYIIETVEKGIQESYNIHPFNVDKKSREFSLEVEAKWPVYELFLGLRGNKGVSKAEVLEWVDQSFIGSQSVLADLELKRIRGIPRKITEGNEKLIPMGGVHLVEITTSSKFFKPGETLIVSNPADRHSPDPPVVEILLYVENSEEEVETEDQEVPAQATESPKEIKDDESQ